MSRFLKALPFLLVSTPAFAHVIQSNSSGFLEGFIHPYSGFDHLLAMLSIGLWASQQSSAIARYLPMAFGAFMLTGATLGLQHIHMPFAEIGIALSVLAIGVLLLSTKINALFSCGLISLFGLFHGYAHGIEFAHSHEWLQYGAGFLLGSLSLYLIGLYIGPVLKNINAFSINLLKAGGLAIALMGSIFLKQMLIA